MAKEKMACPISHGVCVECAIYRGRHYYLCYAANYRGHASDSEGLNKETGKKDKEDITFGMPAFLEVGSSCIKNVEEIVERREL